MVAWRISSGGLVLVAVVASALALAGCPEVGGGCAKDTDCKGDRVCVRGDCVEPSAKGAQAPTQQQGFAPATAAADREPGRAADPAVAPTAAAGSVPLAADGLPVEIPAPGSAPPSVAEWNAVTREVTVRGSSRLKCETKMLREWLRVDCHKNHKGEPFDIYHEPRGQQAYKFVGNGKASVVVQVVRGKEYRAQYKWDRGGAHSGAELVVSWPQGAPRPQLSLTEN